MNKSFNDTVGKDFTSAEAIRNLNRAHILAIIRQASPITLSELVERTPLSRSTVTSIVHEMQDVGLLVKAGHADSTGGRRSTLLDYHPEAIKAIGITRFSDKLNAVLTDLEGYPLKRREKLWNGPSSEHFVDIMSELIEELIEGEDRNYIVGVGVGMPGIVDVDNGLIIEHVSQGFSLERPIDVKSILEKNLGLPTKIANRSRTAALGEIRVGVGQGVKNMLYVFLGQGIVSGIVINGEIFFGSSFSAGELGHNTVNPTGPICGCGNQGCLEVYATESAIIAHAIAKARSNPKSLLNKVLNGNLQLMTFNVFMDCARKGDPSSLELIAETGQYLGLALSSAINLLNPDLLVLGGPVGSNAGDLLLNPIVQEIRRRALSLALKNLRIKIGSSEATEVATIGAACLVLNDFAIERFFSVLEKA